MIQGLDKGDRLPDFERYNAQNKPLRFYQAFCGRPVVLLVCDKTLTPASKLIQHSDNWDTVCIINGTAADAASYASRLPAHCEVIADDGTVCSHLLGTDCKVLTITLILDANTRVLARFQNHLTDHGKITQIYQTHRKPEGRLIQHQAPALIIDHVFEPEFCESLISTYHQQGNESSGILRQVDDRMVYQADETTKIRREHRVEDPQLKQAIEQRLARRVLPEIQITSHYPITQYEGFKVVCYSASDNGYFKTHRDNDGQDTQHRRFALTLNLNSDQYQGGELRFPEYSHDYYKPKTGSAIVFSCSIAHEALPVTQGERYALVSFFYGKSDRLNKVDYQNKT